MSEGSKELVSKASSPVRGSWVRIPLSPPCFLRVTCFVIRNPFGSYAAKTSESCQVLTEAALRKIFRATWANLAGFLITGRVARFFIFMAECLFVKVAGNLLKVHGWVEINGEKENDGI